MFAAFPGGGEVFAIGLAGRMPLERMALDVTPVTSAPASPHGNSSASAQWFTLTHRASGRVLQMVPPRAAVGSWMVMLAARSDVQQNGHLFCVDPSHGLFSYVTRGYVNLISSNGAVLLRGHGNVQRQAAGREATSRATLLRVSQAALAADAAFWNCTFDTQAQSLPSEPSHAAEQPPPSSTQPYANLSVLTYATKATPMLCDSLLAALHFRVPLLLLGFGEAYRGNFQKLRAARDVVGRMHPDELILFADAYDVLYGAGTTRIVRGWDAIGVDASRILFQAERGCWPDAAMGPIGQVFCSKRYPKSRTPYRYVNSGVWMGRAAAAFRLFTELVAYTPGLDDQHVVGHIYVDLQHRFALDRHARLLQSMHADSLEDDLERRRAPSGEPLVYNKLTKTFPPILHFNGGGKRYFTAYYHHLLAGVTCSQIRDYVERAIPTASADSSHGGEIPFRTVCPADRYPLPPENRVTHQCTPSWFANAGRSTTLTSHTLRRSPHSRGR